MLAFSGIFLQMCKQIYGAWFVIIGLYLRVFENPCQLINESKECNDYCEFSSEFAPFLEQIPGTL